MLDPGTYTVGGVGFAGVGGRAEGFGPKKPNRLNEPGGPGHGRTGRREAGRLDQALASLDTPVKVAVLHFAPTVTTLAGGPWSNTRCRNSVLGRVIDKHSVVGAARACPYWQPGRRNAWRRAGSECCLGHPEGFRFTPSRSFSRPDDVKDLIQSGVQR